MFVTLPFNQYREEESIRVFDRRMQASLTALPGVRSVALGNNLPLDGWDIGQPVSIVGDPPADASSLRAAHYVMVNPTYFDTLGIAITAGRAFDAHDVATSEPVCIVNPEFVRRFLGGRDPLRAAAQVPPMAFGPSPPTPARRIVGVAAQVAIAAGEVEKAATIYVPVEQNAWYTTAIAIRTDGDPMRVVDPARRAIAAIDPAQPVTRVRTLQEIAGEAVVRPAFRARLVGAFAGVATTLAGIGIFGVLMFSVRERTREFGVRRALGATPAHIVRDVAASGARIAITGTIAGVAAAAALTRLLSSLLFGVAPLDPVTFVAAPATLAAVAIAACIVPALVAVRADPAVALRQE
jgi:predicted permease